MNSLQHSKNNIHNNSSEISIGSINKRGIMNLLHSTAIKTPDAINELIHNSIDAGAKTINFIINSSTATICISDNGIGMDKQGLQQCFDLFGCNKINQKSIGCKGAGLKIAGPSLTPTKQFQLFTKKKNTTGWRCNVNLNVELYDIESDFCKVRKINDKELKYFWNNRSFTKTLTDNDNLTGTDIEFQVNDSVLNHIKQQFNHEVNIDDDDDALQFTEQWVYLYANLPIKFNLIQNNSIVSTIDCTKSELDLENINYDAVNFGLDGKKIYNITILFNNKQEIIKCTLIYNNEYYSWSILTQDQKKDKRGSCNKEPIIDHKYKHNNIKDTYEKEVKLIIISPKFKHTIFNEDFKKMPDGCHYEPSSELVDKYYKNKQNFQYNNNQCIKTRNEVRSEVFNIDKPVNAAGGNGASEKYFKALHTRIVEFKYEVSDLSNPNTIDFKFDSIMGTQFNKSQSIMEKNKIKPFKYCINWLSKQFSDTIYNKMEEIVKKNITDSQNSVNNSVVDNSEVDNSEVDNSEVDSSEVDSSEVDSSEVDSSVVDNSEVDNSEVDNSEVSNSEVDNSEVSNSEVSSSEVGNSDLTTLLNNTELNRAEQEILFNMFKNNKEKINLLRKAIFSYKL